MRPVRRAAVLAATTAMLLLGALALASPASAHDALLGSDPAAGSTVTALPAEVVLTFSGELIDSPGGNQVQVSDAGGASLNAGDAAVLDNTLRVPVQGSPAGAVTVLWRAVSSDGHPVSGSFAFTVTAAATSATPTATPTPTATLPIGSGTATDTVPTPLPWIILAVVALAAIVVVIVLVATRRRGSAGTAGDGSGPGSER